MVRVKFFYQVDDTFLQLLVLCTGRSKWPSGRHSLKFGLVCIESTCNAGDPGDPGSASGVGRSPGEGNGYLLQYSCLENPMDRGAWRATVCRVAKSRTLTKELSTRACNMFLCWFPFRGWGALNLWGTDVTTGCSCSQVDHWDARKQVTWFPDPRILHPEDMGS